MDTRFARWAIAAALVASIGMVAPSFSARPAAQEPAAQAPGDKPTFRAGTRLATFDAVVTDKKGRHVTDLTPADFEVIERGKKKTVRQVAYVDVASTAAARQAAAAAAPAPSIAMPGQPGLPSRAETARVMAIVVDDLGIHSFRSIVDTRRMLNRYIDGRLQPADLVAIIRTSGGAGALQQFTTDRRLLKAAVEKVRWSARVWPYDPSGPWERNPVGLADRFEREVTQDGTLGALAYAVRGIQALPGRKTIVFVSEGFQLVSPSFITNDALPAVEQVIDDANRGGVVIYAIDPRGLVNPLMSSRTFTAEQSSSDPSYTRTMDFGSAVPTSLLASHALFEQQGSLEYLSDQTGGFAVLNNNNLAAGLSRISEDRRGYYLIGFDTATAPGVRNEKGDVRIRVNRKDLKVRARRDRFGPADPEALPLPAPADPLISAALSPFATGALDVRLAALFGHDTTEGAFVRTLVAVDPAGLTLAESAGSGREGNLTLLVFAIDDTGTVVAQSHQAIAVRLDADAYTEARKTGLRYGVRLPFKKAGGYQIRAAILDERSQALGAGAQFVEVPRVGRGRVAMSGLVLSDAGAEGQPLASVFAQRTRIDYRGTVYDGKHDDGGLATQATVLRDGKAVYTSKPAPLPATAAPAAEVAPVAFSGTIALGDDLTPGFYTLQVSVVPSGVPDDDKAPKPRATQWIDFEVR
jgi:VWFA-related protein